MARAKELKSKLHQQHKRTSWTRFHLPRRQDWPIWSTGHLDAHSSPLATVPGCQKVWLGRNTDDPEQAALIILWESAEALKNFQSSPACAEFLQGLPEEDVQPSPAPGALLWSASMDDAASSSSATSARFVSFQWNSGYRFEEDLQGRVTLTILAIPYTGDPVPEPWASAVHSTFDQFLPEGCEDLSAQWPGARMHFWTAWAWVDGGIPQQQEGGEEENVAAGKKKKKKKKKSDQAFLCEFRRWNGYHGATPELEEFLAKSPRARQSWAETVAKVMPPVTAWDQERWDVRLMPDYISLGEDEEEEEEEDLDEEDEEYERNMNEFLKQL
ncbi:uncharacterized protein F4812DRAFT_417327, partial [Daldinia caldariorum]|uniref:uncharacterized protein n=1 Tax=Daldinia caldariorum TaxID=326644 RepID=UPI0020080E12